MFKPILDTKLNWKSDKIGNTAVNFDQQWNECTNTSNLMSLTNKSLSTSKYVELGINLTKPVLMS